MKEKVDEIIEKEFSQGTFSSGSDATQFIRGQLYIYIDSLLTLFQSTTADDLQIILDFLISCLTLILKWFEIFNSKLQPYVSHQISLISSSIHYNQFFPSMINALNIIIST
jgi:hypothetical protein